MGGLLPRARGRMHCRGLFGHRLSSVQISEMESRNMAHVAHARARAIIVPITAEGTSCFFHAVDQAPSRAPGPVYALACLASIVGADLAWKAAPRARVHACTFFHTFGAALRLGRHPSIQMVGHKAIG